MDDYIQVDEYVITNNNLRLKVFSYQVHKCRPRELKNLILTDEYDHAICLIYLVPKAKERMDLK